MSERPLTVAALRRMFADLARRIDLKHTGLGEDGGVAHVVYQVVR